MAKMNADRIALWSPDSINAVTARAEQLRTAYREERGKTAGIDGLTARYNVRVSALRHGPVDAAMSDFLAYQMDIANDPTLKNAECGAFKDFYSVVTGRMFAADPFFGRTWDELSFRQRI